MKVASLLLVSLSAAFAYFQVGSPEKRLSDMGNNALLKVLNTLGLNSKSVIGVNNYGNNLYVHYLKKYENGEYSFSAEGRDGQIRHESGGVQKEGTDDQSLVVGGSYFSVTPGGMRFTIFYIASQRYSLPPPSGAGQQKTQQNVGICYDALCSLTGSASG